jgi:hypothetical protein
MVVEQLTAPKHSYLFEFTIMHRLPRLARQLIS